MLAAFMAGATPAPTPTTSAITIASTTMRGEVSELIPGTVAEVARLRRRVAELSSEVERLTAENQALLPDSIGDSIGGSLAEEIITLDAGRPEHSAPALA